MGFLPRISCSVCVMLKTANWTGSSELLPGILYCDGAPMVKSELTCLSSRILFATTPFTEIEMLPPISGEVGLGSETRSVAVVMLDPASLTALRNFSVGKVHSSVPDEFVSVAEVPEN